MPQNKVGKVRKHCPYKEWYDSGEFRGVDASPETSLGDYHMVMKPTEECGDEFIVYYKIDENMFDSAHISVSDMDEWIEDFLSKSEKESFFSNCGVSKEEWLDLYPPLKLFDLLSYYGDIDIFGESYTPLLSIDDIREKTGIELEEENWE